MEKKWIPLMAGCVAVIALGAGYAALQHSAKQAQAASASASASLEAASAQADVTGITYENDGAQISLVKKDDVWQWADDAAFPLTQTYPVEMANWGASLQATARVTDKADNLADFGLAAPKNTITFRDANGDGYTVLLGSQNGQTGEFYVQIQGEDAIYTVDSSFDQAFAYAVKDMLDVEDWPVVSASLVQSVTLERANGAAFTLDVARTEATDSTSEAQTSYTVTENGTASAADDTASADYLSQLAALTFQSCSNYKAVAAEQEACGVGASPATARLTVAYKDGKGDAATFSVLIGSATGDGAYYVRQPSSSAVNTMSGDTLDAFLSVTAQTLCGGAASDSATSQSVSLAPESSVAE